MIKMRTYFKISAIIGIILSFFLLANNCTGSTIPKPRGYYRFDLPDKHYKVSDTALPYKFEYPSYAKITGPVNVSNPEPYWVNISIPQYNATIYLSYIPVRGNLADIVEDVYNLVYKHTVKADAISEQPFENDYHKTYGMLYELGGNAATAVQFYVTDSTRNFVRGSLYFYTEPNYDSLSPLINYFTQDIKHLMQTMEWTTSQPSK